MNRTCAVLASFLLLAGFTSCSDKEPSATTTPTPASPAAQTSAEPRAFKIGDTINVGANGDVINLTITAAQLGGDCKYGTVDSVEPTTDADSQLVQLWAEIEAETLTHNSWTMVDDPEAITKDGFTETTRSASECAPSTDGHSSWSDTVYLGEKIRVYGSFRAPNEFKAIKLDGSRVTREELEKTSDAAPEPATQENESAEPYVVECLEGTPGPALWSDGSTRHSDECFQKMGGPEYLEQESQSGLQPGGAAVNGYGYAPNGARNPSSGEVQAYHGCQDGYIDDPDLCAGAEAAVRAADPNGEIYG